MEHNFIGELGAAFIIIAPVILTLCVGGYLFEKALDRFPGVRRLIERLLDVDLSGEQFEED